MRTDMLLALAFAAIAAAGCGGAPGGSDRAAFHVPARDLTLRHPPVTESAVASPVELVRAPAQRAAVPRTRAPRARRPVPAARHPATRPDSAPTGRAPAPAPARAAAVSAAPPAISEESDPHALAPGKTITIVPASGGSATTPEWTEGRPSDGGRGTTIDVDGDHGGSCGPRGTRGHGGRGWRGGFRSTVSPRLTSAP